MKFLFILTIFLFSPVLSDEIIMDMDGNYILMKDDGTFKKLPAPKTGNNIDKLIQGKSAGIGSEISVVPRFKNVLRANSKTRN